MAATYQGQFCTVLIGNAAGTLVDISAYVSGEVEISLGSDDADATTFGAAGAAVGENHIQGALTSGVKAKILKDTTVDRLLRQIVGSRTGFPLRVYSGANAAPTLGDEVFSATVTLLEPHVLYQPGQMSVSDCNFVPVDSASVVPGFGVY